MKDKLTKKQKLFFWGFMLLLVLIIALVIFLILRSLNPPAHLGTMTVSSGGKTVETLQNVEKEITDNVATSYRSLTIAEITDDIPLIEYDGYDLTIGFGDNDYDILDDFTFDMYDENLEAVYTDAESFEFPDSAGTYIVRVEFSWGYSEKNSILTENFFRLYCSEDSLKTGEEN